VLELAGPYLKTLAVSCQPTLLFGIVPLTHRPVSAITLPPVTTPAKIVAAPQLDTLVVGCGSSAALGGDAESTASDIKARCRQSVTRQHIVSGIGIIAGERAADLAVQIAVRENSTGSVAKICQHARGHDTDPGDEPSSTQIAAPIAADRQVQARLVEVLSQREPTE
jgi:hypothetical protein